MSRKQISRMAVLCLLMFGGILIVILPGAPGIWVYNQPDSEAVAAGKSRT